MACINMYRANCLRKIISPTNCLELIRPHPQRIQCGCPRFSTRVLPARTRTSSILIGITAGVGLGAGYSYYKLKERPKSILNPEMGYRARILKELPVVPISRKVLFPTDSSGLKLTLFQYPTCPFCCKVRSFLDFHGLSYDVVEVNPVMKQQMKWTDYKKVPILLVKVEDGYLQLNDSTMIISALSSYLLDKHVSLKNVSDCYTTIEYIDSDGSKKKEILNRYFLMYQGNTPQGTTKESIIEERKWRKWADDVLVHDLSPNVYRTREEALQAFNTFSERGEWERLFSTWERLIIVYVGALAMWMIGRRLKKKYRLKDDVRESLYDDCNVWLKELKSKGTPYHGGSTPNLADLAVFGVLNSIEGCVAFSDAMLNTNISTWYDNMKAHINAHTSGMTATPQLAFEKAV